MPTLAREKPQQWHRGQGTVAQSQQAGPGATRILGTKNWSGMSRNKKIKIQIKSNQKHCTSLLESKAPKTQPEQELGVSRAGAEGPLLPAGLCLSAELPEALRMCRSVPETITGPGLTGCPCRGFAPGPLTKPHSFTLSITSFYFLSVPSSTSYLSPNLLPL